MPIGGGTGGIDPGANVDSVFGRTGAVVAGNADYRAVAAAGLTGATAAARFVGGTAGGPPTAGTFAVGDFIIDQTGKLFICTGAGTPGTWAQVTGAASGTELDYVQITGNVTVTATADGNSGGTAVIDGNAVTYDGATRVCIEFYSPQIEVSPTAT